MKHLLPLSLPSSARLRRPEWTKTHWITVAFLTFFLTTATSLIFQFSVVTPNFVDSISVIGQSVSALSNTTQTHVTNAPPPLPIPPKNIENAEKNGIEQPSIDHSTIERPTIEKPAMESSAIESLDIESTAIASSGLAHSATQGHKLQNDTITENQEPERHDEGSHNHQPRVTIWAPHGNCSGAFTSLGSPHSAAKVPYAMLRDAAIDRRITSLHNFRKAQHGEHVPFQRLIFYLSIHLSVRPTAENATAHLELPPYAASGVAAANLSTLSLHVDFVTQSEPFLQSYKTYRPGVRNQKRLEVSEWQFVVSVTAHGSADPLSQHALTDRLLALSTQGVVLRLYMPLKRFDGARVSFAPWLTLACVMGWYDKTVFPTLPNVQRDSTPPCAHGPNDANGAILFSGSALHGTKVAQQSAHREIAHFAARGLQGALRFTTVAMSVLVPKTISDIHFLCRGGVDCERRERESNERYLRAIRDVVETELDAIGFDRALFPRLVLLPFCRLGSVASGPEKKVGPCGLSHQGGQYHATFLPYALLGGFYKWAVSYDMDEFVMPVPSYISRSLGLGRVPGKDAAVVLDENGGARLGYMTFSWLNFLMDPKVARNLTDDIVSGVVPALAARQSQEGNNVNCMAVRRTTGKAAVRCDAGVGFTIHSSVVPDQHAGGNALVGKQVYLLSSTFRTWHARLLSSSGQCAYDVSRGRASYEPISK